MRLLYDTLTPGVRLALLGIILLIIVGAGIGGHIYGRQLARSDTQERDVAILQLRAEAQKLDAQITDQNGKLASLQTKLTTTQATLDAIMPSENTYSIKPNQSMIVADGRLTIGLVGPPTNEGITLNINGKQQAVVAGDVVQVAPDASATCKVKIQSFDMFKAMIEATCAEAMPQ